jgi:hypothetical protein
MEDIIPNDISEDDEQYITSQSGHAVQARFHSMRFWNHSCGGHRRAPLSQYLQQTFQALNVALL